MTVEDEGEGREVVDGQCRGIGVIESSEDRVNGGDVWEMTLALVAS